MNLKTVLNITEDNYYVYVNIPEILIDDVEILNDKVGMYARDYNTLLTIVLMTATQTINDQFVTPYDFRSIDP